MQRILPDQLADLNLQSCDCVSTLQERKHADDQGA